MRRFSGSGHTVRTVYTPDFKRDSVIDYRGATTYQHGECCGMLLEAINPDGTYMQYEYDPSNNITAKITPWARTEFTIDKLNRMKTVKAPDSGITEYFYNVVGSRDSTHYPNDVNIGYGFDMLNRPLRTTSYGPDGSVISSYIYILNDAGIRTSVTEVDESKVDYTYDDSQPISNHVEPLEKVSFFIFLTIVVLFFLYYYM